MPSKHAREILIDLHSGQESFLNATLRGLSTTPKAIPSKFLYDARGSALFDMICDLEEYYPTRTELAILRNNLQEITALLGEAKILLEFGSGSSNKTEMILSRLAALSCYVPIDISKEFLLTASPRLAEKFPDLQIVSIRADYTLPMALPRSVTRHEGPIAGLFLGSTIGNFEPADVIVFLTNAARILGPEARFLIGFDLRKDSNILERAYNDAAGVTAMFNFNLLERINRELDARINPSLFKHSARFNDLASRIEMRLISEEKQEFNICHTRIKFQAGESIHTENSYKYTIEQFQRLATAAGFDPIRNWTDSKRMFCLQMMAVQRSLA